MSNASSSQVQLLSHSSFVCPHGLFTMFVALFAVVEPLVFIYMLTFEHQESTPLAFIGGAIGRGTRTQGKQPYKHKSNYNPFDQYP